MKECCDYFFKANDLQNILNQPLRCCGYCGRRLTTKEFKKVMDRGVDPAYKKVAEEKASARKQLGG